MRAASVQLNEDEIELLFMAIDDAMAKNRKLGGKLSMFSFYHSRNKRLGVVRDKLVAIQKGWL